ncbi:MAG TPA: hypothetical protein PK489_09035 [Prolixibacteraceae bacterium]|jgi:hypothetical protein|nr:hypothetical protein [Prolixibacteraceae bacterium]HPJ78926.1 hypothetical protein [Prolixibacteraceae bacterium]
MMSTHFDKNNLWPALEAGYGAMLSLVRGCILAAAILLLCSGMPSAQTAIPDPSHPSPQQVQDTAITRKYTREKILRRADINPEQPVPIEVQRAGRIDIVNRPAGNYTLPQDAKTAVIKGMATREFTSGGYVTENKENKPLKGVLMGDVYIGKAIGESKPLHFQILVDTLSPMNFNQDLQLYEGHLGILLLEDGEGKLVPKKLEDPVMLEISSGNQSVTDPSQLLIDHTNLPTMMVRITDKSETSPLPVLIRTPFRPEGLRVSVNKEPVITVETPPQKLEGLGVEALPVRISLSGQATSGPVVVFFVQNKGTVTPDTLTLRAGQTGSVTLRSKGLGNATLTARADGAREGSVIFRFVFPWMFILFSLIGGLLGALITTKKNQKDRTGRIILTGLITGFIVAVLYYVLGLELFRFELSKTLNEFAVLGVSFLGVLLWDKIKALLS